MLNDFQNVFNLSISLGDVLLNLGFAFLCGMIISLFYKLSYRGAGYTVTFVNALVILGMITSVVIMVIGNNLARAFGLVGAMSIIRFRTAIKETMDIIFIFFSLAIGMAAGVGLHALALVGTFVIGLVLLTLSKSNIIVSAKEEFLLQFYYTQNGSSEDAPYLPIIKRFCKGYKLINVKSTGSGDGLELSYYINLRNTERNPEFIKELKAIAGVNHINLFFDEEHF